ncbi:MAG TPA: hypothetical protein VMV57_13315, partial [Terracidiphilus sp.]|nr:hypothetical protein [Terracidiphilus sp.]
MIIGSFSLFASDFWCLASGLRTRKSPPTGLPAGFLRFLISLALLPEAAAVRRHGCPMMMVVTVMAAGLHLITKIRP